MALGPSPAASCAGPHYRANCAVVAWGGANHSRKIIRHDSAQVWHGAGRTQATAWGRANKWRAEDRNSAAVRVANAGPGIAHLLVMNHRIVDVGRQAHQLRRAPAHRGENSV